MGNKMNRRNFLKLSATTGALLALPVLAKSEITPIDKTKPDWTEIECDYYYFLGYMTLNERIDHVQKTMLHNLKTLDDLEIACRSILPRMAMHDRNNIGIENIEHYGLYARNDMDHTKYNSMILKGHLATFISKAQDLQPKYYRELIPFERHRTDDGYGVRGAWEFAFEDPRKALL